MKRNAMRKNLRQSIVKSFGRYIAIVLIIALGAALFLGLLMTKADMVATGQAFMDRTNMFDLRLMNSYAWTQEHLDAISKLDGVVEAEAVNYMDLIVRVGDSEDDNVYRFITIPDKLNKVELRGGRMPANTGECLVDGFHASDSILGTRVKIREINDSDSLDSITVRELTIVGYVATPLYMDMNRGTTSVGNGSLTSFFYVPEGVLEMDYIPEINITIPGSYSIYTEEYNDALEAAADALEPKLQVLAADRLVQVREEAQDAYNEGKQEYLDGYREYLEGKREAEQELADAHQKLLDGEKEIEDNEKLLEDGLEQIKDARQQLAEGEVTLQQSRVTLANAKSEAYAQMAEANATLVENYKTVAQNQAALESGLAQLDAGIAELDSGIAQLESGLSQMDSGIAQLEMLITILDISIEAAENAQNGNGFGDITIPDIGDIQIPGFGDIQIPGFGDLQIPGVSGLLAPSLSYGRNAQPWHVQLLSSTDSEPEVTTEPTLDEDETPTEPPQEEDVTPTEPPQEEDVTPTEPPTEDPGDDDTGSDDAEVSDLEALKEQRDAYQAQLDELRVQREEYGKQLDELYVMRQELVEQRNELEANRAVLDSAMAQIETGFLELAAGQLQAENQFAAAESQIEAGAAQIEAGYAQLDLQEELLEEGRAELEEGKKELEKGWQEYREGKAEAEQELLDAKKKLDEGRLELQDARILIEKMTENDVIILDRNSNVGYNNLDSSSNIVQGVSRVFPVFFLLVASLVCITTMTRMIDEERTQIGTLKALGYSSAAIISKYLFYSGSGAIIGCGIGVFLGSSLFPSILWEAYKIMLYIQPGLVLTVNGWLCFAIVAVYTAVLLLVTWYCCRRTLKEEPAELIRPKSPEAGKKILMEYLPFWHRISFLNKVTIRNIFRYRQRLAMMLVGIGGCTALLVTGFGLRDSIVNVVDFQFEDVTHYDLQVYLSESVNEDIREDFRETLGDENPYMFFHQSSVNLDFDNHVKEIYIISAGEGLKTFIDLHTGTKELPLPGRNEVILTVGVAEALGIRVGDTVSMRNADLEELNLTVSGIYDNHVYNYSIVSPETIEEQWGYEPEQQMVFVQVKEGQDVHELGAELADIPNVMNVSVSDDMANMVRNMMDALDLVVVVIVFCAGLLAVIVLYNLTNININERIREIATIKVLGFNAAETGAYVFKENLTLTLAGSLFGLVLGYFLLLFVMTQVKIDMVWFKAVVMPMSYVWAFVLTILSALVVDFIFYFRLQKINMAEALKSVE